VRLACGLVAVSVLLHLAALGGLRWTWPDPPALPSAVLRSAMQVRSVPAALAPAQPASDRVAVPDPAPVPVVPVVPSRSAARHLQGVGEPVTPRSATQPTARATASVTSSSSTATTSTASPTSSSSASFPVSSSSAGEAHAEASMADRHDPDPPVDASGVPIYPTLVPPSASLRYRAQRGASLGTAELRWQVVDGGAYEADLELRIDGRVVGRQASRGSFDGAGVAPRRFTERRARGALQAANFERDAGEIVFSGPAQRPALFAGAQDRLSWLLQLAAVAAATPQRAVAGGEVRVFVVGARGEARIWSFRFEPAEAPSAEPAAMPTTQKWVREPDGPYDTRIEVWLDPLRHYLPVRLRTLSAAGLPVLELRLDE
jgi:hypothetical protein